VVTLAADIARCPGAGCPVRETCARYVAGRAGGVAVWTATPAKVGTECRIRIPVEEASHG